MSLIKSSLLTIDGRDQIAWPRRRHAGGPPRPVAAAQRGRRRQRPNTRSAEFVAPAADRQTNFGRRQLSPVSRKSWVNSGFFVKGGFFPNSQIISVGVTKIFISYVSLLTQNDLQWLENWR